MSLADDVNAIPLGYDLYSQAHRKHVATIADRVAEIERELALARSALDGANARFVARELSRPDVVSELEAARPFEEVGRMVTATFDPTDEDYPQTCPCCGDHPCEDDCPMPAAIAARAKEQEAGR